jgi:two-component system NtrC family sensor kinase
MEEEIKILCVDDEPNVLNSLRRIFLDEEYEVLTAETAQAGFQILEKEHIQIVISDYRMPTMDGVEFLREVCTRWPDTVRIVLSGYADTASIVSAINEGQIYKFIPKPWNDDDLRVTVANAIERYHLFKKNAELTSELMKVNEDLTKLLGEKSKIIELKGQMLEATQSIIFSMPVAVLGISDDIVVQCNEAWALATGDSGCPLGATIQESLSPEIVEFIDEVKMNGNAKKKITLNEHMGYVFGSTIHAVDNEEKGIILVFIRGDCL